MAKVEAAFKEELARIVRDGFTEAEFAAAKKEILDQQLAGRSSDRNLITSLATQAHYGWTMQRTEEREAKIAAMTRGPSERRGQEMDRPGVVRHLQSRRFREKIARFR